MAAVSGEEFDRMVRILSDSIDRVEEQAQTRHDQTMAKLDKYIESSEARLRQVEDNQLRSSQHMDTQDSRITALEESKEKVWSDRHPILLHIVQYAIVILMFVLVAWLFPNIAKLIGSI